MESSQNRASFYLFATLLAGMLFLFFDMIRGFLLAIIMGAILALLCGPVYRKILRQSKHSTLVSILVTLALLLLIVVPIVLFTISFVREGIAMAGILATNDQLSLQGLIDRVVEWKFLKDLIGDPESINLQVRNGLQTVGKAGSALILSMIADIPEIILHLVLAAITCFFFLIDGQFFLRWVAERIPLDPAIRLKLAKTFRDTSISAILATLAAASAQAAIMIFSFLILGIPAVVLAGGATFIFAWIPLVGSSPVWISGAIYLAVQDSFVKMFVLLALGLLTGIVDNIIRPLVLKGRGKMHPLVSLIAILGGIRMFGILGVFLGPIIVAILVSLLEVWPMVGKKYGILS